MTTRLKTKTVEVIGTHRDFRNKLNEELSSLENDQVISIEISTSDAIKGHRYLGVIFYRDDSWFV